jgi:hypothetical protein
MAFVSEMQRTVDIDRSFLTVRADFQSNQLSAEDGRSVSGVYVRGAFDSPDRDIAAPRVAGAIMQVAFCHQLISMASRTL